MTNYNRRCQVLYSYRPKFFPQLLKLKKADVCSSPKAFKICPKLAEGCNQKKGHFPTARQASSYKSLIPFLRVPDSLPTALESPSQEDFSPIFRFFACPFFFPFFLQEEKTV